MPSSRNDAADEIPVPGAVVARMEDGDLDQVLAIEEASFANPWRREHFLFEIRDNPRAVNRVVRTQGRVIAYASVWEIEDELKINDIAVAPESRRRGIGGWLLRHVLREARVRGCRLAFLEARASNVAALELYRHHGFREYGRRKNYYAREQEDALLMEAIL